MGVLYAVGDAGVVVVVLVPRYSYVIFAGFKGYPSLDFVLNDGASSIVRDCPVEVNISVTCFNVDFFDVSWNKVRGEASVSPRKWRVSIVFWGIGCRIQVLRGL
jgi:hypothetical protein